MKPLDGSARARLGSIKANFVAAWPEALAVWSRFTRLKPPELCLTQGQARRHGIAGSFAMIRLVDQAVIVSLPEIEKAGLGDYALEVLAHEVGHHVLAPATLADHVRMIARMRWALPTVEATAPLIANLYTDLLINDRLQRSAELRIADIYRIIGAAEPSGAVWTLYLRIYEVLWNLPRGSLNGGATNDELEGDAWLGARVVRSYQREWLDGSGRFAALFFPHVLNDKRSLERMRLLFDTKDAAQGGDPTGLTEAEAGEREGAIHPARDAELHGQASSDKEVAPREPEPKSTAHGQARQPFEYGELLRAAGIKLDDHEVAVRYYRERALPFIVPFPRRRAPASVEPQPEGLEPWEIGQPLDAVDWFGSVIQSARIIPGFTTVQRSWGTIEGEPKRELPLDLDLYVDSSGSMANPQRLVSFPALAGAILCLSALRAGARVHVTLWSGKHQFTSTNGFVRDEQEILRVLTGFFGGGTAFPIHVLRETWSTRGATDRPAHILVVSDDGVSTLFDVDEQGNSGADVARRALAVARGGGSLVLNLAANWEQLQKGRGALAQAHTTIARMRDELGFRVHRMASWDDLLPFAKAFSQERYGREDARPAGGTAAKEVHGR